MSTRTRRARRHAEGEGGTAAAAAAPLGVEGFDDNSAGGFASLPHAFLRALFLLLPADAKLCCAGVCRAWRAALAERVLWRSLDVSPAAGLSVVGFYRGIDDDADDEALSRRLRALLRAAAAKAGGELAALDVSGSGDALELADVADVVRANAASLRELRAHDAHATWATEELAAALAAAPALRVHGAQVACGDSLAVARVLSGEPPFDRATVGALLFPPSPLSPGELRGVVALLRSHVSVTRVALLTAPFHATLGRAALAELVQLAIERPLTSLQLSGEWVAAEELHAALLRLLREGSLRVLGLVGTRAAATLFPHGGASAAALGAALRGSATLTDLTLIGAHLWDDVAAAAALLGALAGHPTLKRLCLLGNTTPLAVGAPALAALLAADAPALRVLDVTACDLGDEGAALLFDALRRNSHLRELRAAHNGITDACVRDVLLPALRANAGLARLELAQAHQALSAAQAQAQALVRQRAAARRA
jgi:hypothetical protein